MSGISEKDAGLRVEDLAAGYGAMRVLSDIELAVSPGSLVAVLGPNGAGKTTALSAIGGLRFGSNRGRVLLDGVDITKLAPEKIAAAGLALVPEGRHLFPELSVLQNLRLGATARPRAARRELESDLRQVFATFPVLAGMLEKAAGSLSGGEQQMVVVAQALMGKPRVLLLDEPTAGLAPIVAQTLFETLHQLSRQGLGVLVVDQDVDRALSFADYCYVMDRGAISFEGAPGELSSGRVREKVLGASG